MKLSYTPFLEPIGDLEVECTRLRALSALKYGVNEEKQKKIWELLLNILQAPDMTPKYRHAAAEALCNYAFLTKKQERALDSKAEQLYRTGTLKGNCSLGNYLAARNFSKNIRSYRSRI